MTSAIPVQRSNQLSYQANWELVNWEFMGSIPVQAWIFSGFFFSTA